MYFEDYAPGRVFELPPAWISREQIIERARRYDPNRSTQNPTAQRRSITAG
jgi:hypothetical protein